MRIEVFLTHIEISPYNAGDCIELEEYLSVWDKRCYCYNKYAYHIENGILYVPKSINLQFLMGKLCVDEFPIYNNKFDEYVKIPLKYKMMAQPRNRIQEDSISFMTSTNEFSNNRFGSQYMLNLDTGLGKTFCMIDTIMYYRMKTLIIVNRESIAENWISQLRSMTDLPKNSIVYLDSYEKLYNFSTVTNIYVCVITHQRIVYMAKEYGWNKIHEWFKNMKFGIKCFDECHRCFHNTIMIDFFSNVYKSFYLSATAKRVAIQEQRLYSLVFSGAYKYGENAANSDIVRKHTRFICIQIRSNPNDAIVRSRFGFSNYKYIEYALSEPNNTLLRAYERILEQTEHLEGRTLVITPKIESTEAIASFTKNCTNRTCKTVHSKNSIEENEEALEADIISSTFGSIGESLNIKKLRSIIVLQGIGNRVNMSQLRGRLREYDENHDTFIFYVLDISFSELTELYNRAVKPVMKQKAKEIITMKWFDI